MSGLVLAGWGFAGHLAVRAAASEGLSRTPAAGVAVADAAAWSDAIDAPTSNPRIEASLAALAAATRAAATVHLDAPPKPAPSGSTGPVPSTRPDTAAMQRASFHIDTAGPWSHRCLSFVRTVLGLPGQQATAISAWNAARYKHVGDLDPPAGVPVFWSGGTTSAGHVALSTGNGWIITTDYPSAGHISEIPLSQIAIAWHLQYLGWTEDLEGSRIHPA